MDLKKNIPSMKRSLYPGAVLYLEKMQVLPPALWILGMRFNSRQYRDPFMRYRQMEFIRSPSVAKVVN